MKKTELSPLIVMTAITGKPSEAEILSYLDEMHEHGIDQLLLYPRSGCELSYMSEQWLDTVGHFLAGAKARGMAVWLYDEFNWPSGDAGGRVTAEPRFRLKAIKTRGEHAGEVVTASRHNANVFGEKFFPDLLSPEAVELFISETHEQYYAHFSEYFGNVICGMFTDEPSIGYCCRGADGRDGLVPYYDGMAEDYQNASGRDFYADMHAGEANFYALCLSLVSTRFSKNYLERLSTWCREHGILMTGHLFEDDAPAAATRGNGNFLYALRSFMMPGIDNIDTDLASPHLFSLFGAAEYASGEHGAMAELFALGPCDMSYAKRLCTLFLAACFKIDHYFLAISPLDMRGNTRIPDYFNCFRAAQPDFGGMPLLAERARVAARLAKKDFAPDVYVRYPYLALSERFTDMPPIDSAFSLLLNELTKNGIQWKFIREGEAPTNAPIIALSGQGDYQFAGKAFQNPQDICKQIKGSASVLHEDGSMPSGLFARRFTDGELVVLNLYGKKDYYVADGKRVLLEEHGVYYSGDEAAEPNGKRIPLQASLAVRHLNKNLIRLMYLNGKKEAEVVCRGELPVLLSVREEVAASLDGKPIACADEDSALPQGMSRFYRSAPVLLTDGAHTVSAEKEHKYLPAVFLGGDFSAAVESGEACRVRLGERTAVCRIGEQFEDYGRAELSAEISVPQDAAMLELLGSTLYTAVLMDGEMLGECIAPPYRYAIPPHFAGKTVTLTVKQASSLGPLFGDTAYFDREDRGVSWRGTPATGKTLFGFTRAEWILKDS